MADTIDDLWLTARTYTCLHAQEGWRDAKLARWRAGERFTVWELAQIPDAQLLKVKNFGRKSLADLRACICEWQQKQGLLSTPADGLAEFRLVWMGL